MRWAATSVFGLWLALALVPLTDSTAAGENLYGGTLRSPDNGSWVFAFRELDGRLKGFRFFAAESGDPALTEYICDQASGTLSTWRSVCVHPIEKNAAWWRMLIEGGPNSAHLSRIGVPVTVNLDSVLGTGEFFMASNDAFWELVEQHAKSTGQPAILDQLVYEVGRVTKPPVTADEAAEPDSVKAAGPSGAQSRCAGESVEARLKALADLKAKGLISEAEAAQKSAEILKCL